MLRNQNVFFFIRDAVCGSFSCYASPNLCSSPIKPEDHCCYDVCGAAVHVDTEGYRTLKLSMLHGAAKQILSPASAPLSARSRIDAAEKDSVSFDHVQYYTSRITSSRSTVWRLPCIVKAGALLGVDTWEARVGVTWEFYFPPPIQPRGRSPTISVSILGTVGTVATLAPELQASQAGFLPE